jgi:plasmid stability protein
MVVVSFDQAAEEISMAWETSCAIIAIMSQLVVRNLEESLVRKLKKRAVEHGVSAEEEHRRILRTALIGPEDEFPDLKAVLLAMPDAGEDQDFARLRDLPRELDLL